MLQKTYVMPALLNSLRWFYVASCIFVWEYTVENSVWLRTTVVSASDPKQYLFTLEQQSPCEVDRDGSVKELHFNMGNHSSRKSMFLLFLAWTHSFPDLIHTVLIVTTITKFPDLN